MYIRTILLIIIIIYLILLIYKKNKEKFTNNNDDDSIIKSYIKEVYLEDLINFKKLKEQIDIMDQGKLTINGTASALNLSVAFLKCKSFIANELWYSGSYKHAPYSDGNTLVLIYGGRKPTFSKDMKNVVMDFSDIKWITSNNFPVQFQ